MRWVHPFNDLRGLEHFQTDGTYGDKRDENEMPHPNGFTKGIYTKKDYAYQADSRPDWIR